MTNRPPSDLLTRLRAIRGSIPDRSASERDALRKLEDLLFAPNTGLDADETSEVHAILKDINRAHAIAAVAGIGRPAASATKTAVQREATLPLASGGAAPTVPTRRQTLAKRINRKLVNKRIRVTCCRAYVENMDGETLAEVGDLEGYARSIGALASHEYVPD